ncbi:hypothetical protein JCM14467A_17620 [Vulcanisaeta sp. JCM 14467]
MEFSVDSLRRNRFCIGVKRGGEYVCGGDASEEKRDKTVGLLAEAINRMLRWHVWETWWVEEVMDEWLEKRDRLELQLRGKYNDDVVNDLLRLVDKFIGYNEQFLNYWREVGNEVEKLIEDLINGRAEVVIRSEGVSGISVHGEHITLKVNRTNTSITVHITPKGLEGMTIRVPDVFRKTMSRKEYRKFVKRVLRALRGGFEETDGTIKEGKAAMGTAQIWQVIVWSLLYPSELYVLVDVINVNEGSVTIAWRLRTSNEALKGKMLNNVDKLSEEGLLAFMLGAVLGDGYADVEKLKINGRVYDEAVVKITMSDEEFKKWEPLLERLKGMGLNWRPDPAGDGVVDVRFYGSNAINLAGAMINVLPPILRDILDALGFEKWERIKRIAEMEVKYRRGESQVIVAGYKFTVNARDAVLVHKAKDRVEAEEIIDALRAVYGDEFYTYVNKSGKYLAVIIPMYVFERYDEIKKQVIEVLCRKLERTKDERKKQTILKHLIRLATLRTSLKLLINTTSLT